MNRSRVGPRRLGINRLLPSPEALVESRIIRSELVVYRTHSGWAMLLRERVHGRSTPPAPCACLEETNSRSVVEAPHSEATWSVLPHGAAETETDVSIGCVLRWGCLRLGPQRLGATCDREQRLSLVHRRKRNLHAACPPSPPSPQVFSTITSLLVAFSCNGAVCPTCRHSQKEPPFRLMGLCLRHCIHRWVQCERRAAC